MEDIIGISDGININNLVTNGVTFDVNNIQDALDEKIVTDDKDDEYAVSNKNSFHDPLGKFQKEPFSELWSKMEKVDDSNDLIRKLIVKKGSGGTITDKSIIKILFCTYFDGESKPYTSTRQFSPFVIHIDDSGLLPGIELAIRSMMVGEHSRFLIHYSLMYGELGSPPFIPKKAMCLVHCVIMSASTEDTITENNLCDDGNEIKDSFKNMKIVFDKGIRSYNSADFKGALNHFNKALMQLEECRLANEEEESFQNQFLLKIYLNLAICYNKINLPLRACTMCNNYNRLRSVWRDWKILFQNGKALMMIGEFKESRKKLIRSEKLNPHSEEIKKCIIALNEKETTCRNFQNELSKFIKNEEKNKDSLKSFEEELKLICISLKADTQLNRITLKLPTQLTGAEVSAIENVVKEADLFSTLKENFSLNHMSITISKEK